jgi:hypothetical protein
MARAFFEEGAFFEPGAFFAEIIPAAPAIINLGLVGNPLHALPFRALGGSVADLDLLYGVLGKEAWKEDIQPFFTVMLRDGEIRLFGYELPRAGILDATFHAAATLMRCDRVRIEGNPAGDNLFGYVGLTTRPISRVQLRDPSGEWMRLIDLELVLNAPAGLYVDIAHSVVMPVLTGTITGYRLDGSTVELDYGMSTRRAQPLD